MPGVLAHDDIIGSSEGCTVNGSTGRSFLVLRPTLSDIVLKMPRGAQVIYPKDLGAILIAADIAPGPARPRGGRRLGRPLHDRAARRRLHRRLRAAGGLRRAGPGQRGRRAGPRRALPRRDPRRDRGHRRVGPRPDPARHARAPQGGRRRPPRPCAPAASCWPICPPSTRPRCCARRSTRTGCPSAWPRRRRSCAGPGTSRRARSGPTTAWWATPASSPRRGGSRPDGVDRGDGDAAGLRRRRSARSSARSSTGCTPSSWPSTPRPRSRSSYGMPAYRVGGGAGSTSASGSTACPSTAGGATGTVGSWPAHPELSSGKGTHPDRARRRRGDHRRRTAGVARRARSSPDARRLVALDEDALAGALLGGLDHRILEVARHRGHPGRAARARS